MGFAAIKWSYAQWMLSPPEKAVLLVYAFHANRSAMAWPSEKLVAQESSFAYATVKRAVKKLVSSGYLIDVGSRGRVTRYQLRVEVPVVALGMLEDKRMGSFSDRFGSLSTGLGSLRQGMGSERPTSMNPNESPIEPLENRPPTVHPTSPSRSTPYRQADGWKEWFQDS